MLTSVSTEEPDPLNLKLNWKRKIPWGGRDFDRNGVVRILTYFEANAPLLYFLNLNYQVR